jgi:hypothetical protein
MTYSLYILNHLVPAIQRGESLLSLLVDGELFGLVDANAAIGQDGNLYVSGFTSSPSIRIALSRGTSTSFRVAYNGNLMLTQMFTLKGSAKALSATSCHR